VYHTLLFLWIEYSYSWQSLASASSGRKQHLDPFSRLLHSEAKLSRVTDRQTLRTSQLADAAMKMPGVAC